MRYLTLNDGTRHPINRCGAYDGILWLCVTDMDTLLEAAQVFSNAEATAHMVDQRDAEGAMRYEYDGYTQLTNLSIQEEGILLSLRRVAAS